MGIAIVMRISMEETVAYRYNKLLIRLRFDLENGSSFTLMRMKLGLIK